MRRVQVAAGACALLALYSAATVSAGELRGRLLVPARGAHAAPLNAYPGQLSAEHGAEGGVAHGAKSGITAGDAVVSLAPASGAPAAARRAGGAVGRRAALRQTRQMFEPRVLPILVGSVVDFPNDDAFYHNVFSYSSAKRFDLGRYGKGKSGSQTFDRPGLVKVFCDIHSDMAAFIVVLETPHFTAPADDGAYAVAGVPAGQYAVTVWHPDLPEWHGSVTIPADGAVTLDVDLR